MDAHPCCSQTVKTLAVLYVNNDEVVATQFGRLYVSFPNIMCTAFVDCGINIMEVTTLGIEGLNKWVDCPVFLIDGSDP